MAQRMMGGQVAVAHGLSVNIQSDHSMVPPLPDIAPPSAPMSVFEQKFHLHAVFRFTAALDVLQQIVLH